jgi:hypothetical protein
LGIDDFFFEKFSFEWGENIIDVKKLFVAHLGLIVVEKFGLKLIFLSEELCKVEMPYLFFILTL